MKNNKLLNLRPKQPGLNVGRGMGSPIPSVQEGAWVREDPKVVGGGYQESVDPFDLEP